MLVLLLSFFKLPSFSLFEILVLSFIFLKINLFSFFSFFFSRLFDIIEEKESDIGKLYLPFLLKLDFFKFFRSVSIFDLLISFREIFFNFFIGELL